MPFYHTLGNIPQKRHTVFKNASGGYYYEHLMGTHGFSGVSSLLYHVHRPTMIKNIVDVVDLNFDCVVSNNIQPRKFIGFNLTPENDFLSSRKPIMVNSDVSISLCLYSGKKEEYFFKNGDKNELYFIHKGSGILYTMFGQLRFEEGDYINIPKSTIYRFEFDDVENKFLLIESFSQFNFPRRYLNNVGQLLEHAPFCERDLNMPVSLETYDEEREVIVKVKKLDQIFSIAYPYHPFDIVGWDGYCFPYSFSIYDFEPITGRVHQPPPVHQTFEGQGFVVCSFCPRMYDYHPDSVPAPYNHSNVDSDEVLYYVDGDFMSRNDIDQGYFTLHPSGVPHGPHPGAMERSIGKKKTEELAVMIDTFKPLQITKYASEIEDQSYLTSWL